MDNGYKKLSENVSLSNATHADIKLPNGDYAISWEISWFNRRDLSASGVGMVKFWNRSDALAFADELLKGNVMPKVEPLWSVEDASKGIDHITKVVYEKINS